MELCCRSTSIIITLVAGRGHPGFLFGFLKMTSGANIPTLKAVLCCRFCIFNAHLSILLWCVLSIKEESLSSASRGINQSSHWECQHCYNKSCLPTRIYKATNFISHNNTTQRKARHKNARFAPSGRKCCHVNNLLQVSRNAQHTSQSDTMLCDTESIDQGTINFKTT